MSTITPTDTTSNPTHSTGTSSQSRPLPPKSMSARKPVPAIAHGPVAFPADSVSHSDPPVFTSQRRYATSGPSPYKRTMSSPSPPPPLSRLISKSPLLAGHSSVGPVAAPVLTQQSSSLARNSSVPASLTHNTPSSNLPTRSASISISQPRPSLSSPSPPTPIVPSIPLRHATQRSPPQPSYNSPVSNASLAKTPNSAPIIFSRGSLDRQLVTKKPFPENSPSMANFCNASDPNLPSRSATSTPVIEPNYCTLPLKQLLAKPANPSSAFQSGSEPEGGSIHYYGNHRRSTSITDSSQFAIARRSSDISVVELSAVRPLQSRSPAPLNTGLGDRYRSRPAVGLGKKEYEISKKNRTVRIQCENNTPKGEEQSGKPGTATMKHKGNEPRPRNVLRRRPSNSFKPEPRDSPSGGPRLSRSLSASSLFKRAGLFTSLNPNLRTVSPSPKSPSGLVSLVSNNDRGVHSHDNHNSAQQQSHQNIDICDDAVTNKDSGMKIIPTGSSLPSLGPKQSSLRVLSPAPSSPALGDPPRAPNNRLSTISSKSSATTTPPASRDKYLSPAGAVADAYKREQSVKEAPVSTEARPTRSISPSPSPTFGDHEVPSQSSPPAPTAPLANTTTAGSARNSQRSSESALSYAELNSKNVDRAEKTVNPTGEKKEAAKGTQQPLSSDAPVGFLVTREVAPRSSLALAQSPQPSEMAAHTYRSSTSSPLASPPIRTSSNEPRNRNRLRKTRHGSDQTEFAHSPYYTVVGSRNDQVYGVGSPRDSFGAGYSAIEKASWGIRTTITAGAAPDQGEKDKPSIGRSLTRKMSGKFKRPRSAGGGAIDEKADLMTRGRASTWQDGRAPPSRPQQGSPKDRSEKSDTDDRCLPYLYSLKKQAQSEMDLSVREKEKQTYDGGGGGGASGGSMLPKIWRMFGRSKSKERNEVDIKTEATPPLPALPKHYVSASNDIYMPTYSRSHKGQDQSPRTTLKSPGSRSGNKASPTSPSGRPSTATRSSSSEAPSTPFWNRTHSAHSSVSSLMEVPPMPSPLPDLTRYATDETDSGKTTKVTKAARTPRKMEAKPEEEVGKSNTNLERSDSPHIPIFSTAEPINSFAPRRSSERSKSSPTTPTSTPSPTSPPPPRPARSAQRPKIVHSRTSSFTDEALYPPVMNQSSRSIPTMRFREMDSEKRQALTEQEKLDRWAALLKKSDAAGGTLHFEGGADKLESDELRFSRTLSELARDDE